MNVKRVACLVYRRGMNNSQKNIFYVLGTIIIFFCVSILTKDGMMETFEQTKTGIFAHSLAAIWIGLFNTVGIWDEEKIYVEEDWINKKYSHLDYIMAVLISQTNLCIFEAIIGTAIFVLQCELHFSEGVVTQSIFIDLFITNLLTIGTAMLLGLMLGTIMKNMNITLSTIPFILITQLLMSEGICVLPDKISQISNLIIAKYSLSSFGSLLNINIYPSKLKILCPTIEQEASSLFQHDYTFIITNWRNLATIFLVSILITVVILSFKFHRKK
ncbi:MAG: ABC transporter permease [Lachnospiraceae bacterium]|nr:ABC transporter permease [Lachnospiraceae bacterium]